MTFFLGFFLSIASTRVRAHTHTHIPFSPAPPSHLTFWNISKCIIKDAEGGRRMPHFQKARSQKIHSKKMLMCAAGFRAWRLQSVPIINNPVGDPYLNPAQTPNLFCRRGLFTQAQQFHWGPKCPQTLCSLDQRESAFPITNHVNLFERTDKDQEVKEQEEETEP